MRAASLNAEPRVEAAQPDAAAEPAVAAGVQPGVVAAAEAVQPGAAAAAGVAQPDVVEAPEAA